MPKKKIKPQKSNKEVSFRVSKVLGQKNWPESYTSLVLGLIVVVVVAILVVSFFKSRQSMEVSSDKTQRNAELQELTQEENNSVYTVVEGDNLWTISEKFYQTGYKWVDIAKMNNLSNPDVIEKGVKLKIPKIEQQKKIVEPVVAQPNTISGTTYTVKQSEFLWDIAVRAYGDGYKWLEIANVNNISNPDYIIFTGDVLKIPR